MITYKDLISRVDSAWLQEQVGEMAVRVMQAFEERGVSTAELRRVFFSIVNPYDLLSDASSRASLFELLRVEEAHELCKILELSSEPTPYESLASLQVYRSSEKFEIFCNFLGLPTEERLPKNENPTTTLIHANYSLFEHQRIAVQGVEELLRKTPKRVVLHMPTGAGKTRMAMHVVCQHLISNPNTVIVWLANSEELCEQAAEEFIDAWSYLGNRSLHVHRFWGGHALDLQQIKDGFFVGGFPKLYALARNRITDLAALGDKTSLIVVDEAHKVIAPTYELIIDALSARKMQMPLLGLTATPGRTWNEPEADEQLANFFHKKKITLKVPGFENPVDYLVSNEYLAEPIFRRLKYVSGNLTPHELKVLADDLDVPVSIMRKLAEDERRSVLIVRELEAMLDRHNRMIVFATTVAHAEMLSAVLSARGHSTRCITGDTVESQRSEYIAWYKSNTNDKRIIINFGVLTTGFDAPKTSAALIARPTKSLVLYSQMVGRAIRGKAAGGNEKAEIVTVVDTDLPGFGDLSLAFTNWEDVW